MKKIIAYWKNNPQAGQTKQQRIDRAIDKLDKPFLFWGNVPDVLADYNLYDKASTKEVLDYLGSLGRLPRGLRSFVYDQMTLRRQQYYHLAETHQDYHKLKKVMG